MKYFFKALLVLVFFLPGLLFSQAKLNLDESVWGTPVWEDNFDSYSTYSDLEITGRYKLDDTRRDQGNIVEEGQISFDTENDYLIFTAERLPSPVFDQCIDSDSNGVVDQFLYNGLPCDASTPIPDEYRYKTGGLIVEEVINDGINGTPLNGINDFAEHQGCTSTDYGGFYYGMYEIRFKFPTVDNTWPAFWLYTGSDEFDVLELIDLNKFSSGFIDWTGGETSPGFHQNPNYDPNSSAYQIVSDCVSFHQFQRNLSDEWHLLQMVWTPDQISVFFDGIEMKTETRFEVWSCAPDLRFNLYAHAFRPETNFEKAEFLIDYVRVYNKTSWDIADDTTWDSDYMEEYEVRSTSTYQANASPKAIAAGEGNNLFFRDINNQMIYSYFANGDINNIVTHNLGNIASGGPNSSWDVYGDVVVGVNNQVFYPGIDGTLQNYYYKNSEGPGGGWQHGFVDLVIEAEMGVSTKVHLDCGSLDVASIAEGGNRVFYRGQDDLMHYFFWNPSHPNALYNGWVHLNLHMEAGAMDPNARVSGNVVAADGHKVFYRGNDGRIQSFGFDGTNWNHDVIDWNWGNDKFLVSSACGSMDAVKLNGTQHLFYRGQADDQMHHFFYDLSHPAHLGNGWVHEYMPYDHSIQLIDGPVQVDSDGNVYYGSEPLIPLSNLSLVGTYIYYSDDWYHQLAVGGVAQFPPPANSPIVNGGITIGDSWENALIYFRSPGGTVSFLNKIASSGQFVDLTCSPDLVNSQTVVTYHFESTEDGGDEASSSELDITDPLQWDGADSEGEVTIFPNPTSNTLMVKAGDQMDLTGELRIINALGAICHLQKVNEVPLVELDCTKLPAGIYYLSFLSDNDKASWEKTFVVE